MTESRSHLKGYLFTLIGAIMFSTKAIIVKLSFRETQVDPISLLALRMVFSLPFFLITGYVASKNKEVKPLSTKQWYSIIGLGLLGYYLSSLLDFIGLKYITAGLERLILFLYPTFTVLINHYVFKEPFTRRQLSALSLCYAGICFTFYNEMWQAKEMQHMLLGSGLIFLCSVTYASYLVGTGRLLKQINVLRYTSLAMLSATAGVLIHYVVQGQYGLSDLKGHMVMYGILLAIVATVIPNFLISRGIQLIGSNHSAILSAIGPVSTILLAYFFLGENLDFFQIIGTGLVIGGVIILGWKK